MMGSVDSVDHPFMRGLLIVEAFVCFEDLRSVRAKIQRSISPFVDKYYKKEDHEYHDADVSIPSKFRKCDSPGHNKNGLHVKNHEEHGDKVELGRKPQTCRTLTEDSALIRFFGGILAMTLPQYKRKAQHYEYQAQNNGSINEYGPKQSSFI